MTIPSPFEFTSGSFVIRLAENAQEIEAAQRLRYHVFHEEMGSGGASLDKERGIDSDQYDDVCDHLLVFDKDRPEGEQVIGNYRLLRHESANKVGGFYTAAEFDISLLLEKAETQGTRLMELGRSCVHKDYRTNATIQLLWKGITAYVLLHKIDVLFGCASFGETDAQKIQLPLAYLKAHHMPPASWSVKALPEQLVPMPEGDILEGMSLKHVLSALPPLVKGYLRLGAWIGEGAVLDQEFGTIDVCIILPAANIPARYYTFFDRG